ncbi:hypothetical protein EUTSA_v10009680mg [Eutrema salsugineum]|uniref:F-box domain-containing protein n=1 Tax=Eutrema salsugineum TaxID=72664 RepID=V4K7P3_EUTSA|nr:F-box/LRR-repeat/kelch-repeat protein At1g09650 [Eutrema salsugineum]ESQ33635.1 hypothetical protein EUTSA_v10009680mg [Eutrema salsugineum]
MSLAQDLVEDILERLPVKSLLRFKLVSKTWKTTIESQHFKERHMIRRQLREPDFLLIDDQDDDDLLDNEELMIRTLVMDPYDDEDLGEAEPGFCIQLSFDDVSRSCDGLVCIYDFRRSILMVNPSTKWMREVPRANLQALLCQRYGDNELYLLGFGKDIRTKTYKLVWLYNSFELDLEGATTCEVFDFNINTWRHVESSPYRILGDQNPIYVDGLLNWFIFKSNTEIKIISFDCHTEIFQEISESPITQYADECRIIMCNLNNRLCVSEKKWPTQDIWTLKCSDMMMTWEKMYSLNLSSCPDGLLSDEMWPIACPLAVLNNKKLLLFDEDDDNPNLVIYDLETRSYSLCVDAGFVVYVAPYFQSLISIT